MSACFYIVTELSHYRFCVAAQNNNLEMNTDNILYYLNDLRETLKKHRNVKAVYKSFSGKEKESHRKILDYKENLYFESWQAFISNLSMLREINLEASDENKPTREVMEAAYRLFDYCYMEKNWL